MVKKYQIIYADPPWSYRDKALDGKGSICHYTVQSDNWICSLDVSSIAADDCVLFLWITMPKLPVAFDVIKSWGFEYKTCAFTWIKRNKKSHGLFLGLGRWTRSNPELCLLATKGKPKRISCNIRSVVVSRLIGHSIKPDEVRDRIVQLMGDLPRIELFARERVVGWDVWGDEIDSDVEIFPSVDLMSEEDLIKYVGVDDD